MKRILFIDNYYPEFLKEVEPKAISRGLNTYEAVKEDVFSYCFGTADFYSRNIRRYGWEAEDIIINYNRLQNLWAKKYAPSLQFISSVLGHLPKIRNVYLVIGNPLIILNQVQKFKPDVVYVQCIGALHPWLASQIKKNTRLLVGQIAAKLPPDKFFVNYDLVLSSLPPIVDKMRSLGIASEYFRLGFEDSILDKISYSPKKFNVTHIGGYDPVHSERNAILEELAKEVRVDFWGYGIDNLKWDSPILSNFHGTIWGIEMYNILANSKITVTGHVREIAGDFANNMRLYEATGCGTLLMVDKKKNLDKLFRIGKEVIAYTDPKDLIQKVKYYLEHDSEREKIAKAGQRRTLSEHTYKLRMGELDEILRKYLGK